MVRTPNSARGVCILSGWLALVGCNPRAPLETVAGRPASAAKSASVRKAADATDDEKQIRALFDRFWQHAADHEGEKAVACLDQKSIDWYETVRKDTLTLTRPELQKQDLLRRLWILKLRRDFDRSTLTRATGRELYAKGIALGWFDAIVQSKLKLAYVGSNGKSAHALIEGGSNIPSFFFEKETDGWRLSEIRLHEHVLNSLQTGRLQSGLNEERFLVKVLVEETGYKRPVDERIFDGPLDKLPG